MRGGCLNVDIVRLNRHYHPGSDSARIGHPDPNRAHHNSFLTRQDQPLYDNAGRAVSVIKANTPVVINAGAITKLVIAPNTPPVYCVFVFGRFKHDGKLDTSVGGGWMKASNLPPRVKSEQLTLAGRIAHQRVDAHHQFSHTGVPIRPSTPLTDKNSWLAAEKRVDRLYTYPTLKKQRGENHATDYFNNLSLNVPNTGGKRFGVETDRLPPDSSYRNFFPEIPRHKVTIPLFAKGSGPKDPSRRTLTFVYGYVKNDANSKIYGWINQLMLLPS